ncbi:MAG: TRAP transporter small permease subunit [Bacillota bacterium]
MIRVLRALDRALGAITAAGLALVLPLSFLLFAQWPLREVVQAYSREANDLAQILFAIYVSLAITYATRRRGHIAADAFAHRYPERFRERLARIASFLVLLPWSAFILYAVTGEVWRSVRQLEAFPDTFNPGYFVIRLSLWLLAVLVCLQAILDAAIAKGRKD